MTCTIRDNEKLQHKINLKQSARNSPDLYRHHCDYIENSHLLVDGYKLTSHDLKRGKLWTTIKF